MADREIISEGFMLSQGFKPQKIHDLTILLKRCLEKAPRMAELFDDCNMLSTFYVETRYPVHWPATFAHEDAEQAFRAAPSNPKLHQERIGFNG